MPWPLSQLSREPYLLQCLVLCFCLEDSQKKRHRWTLMPSTNTQVISLTVWTTVEAPLSNHSLGRDSNLWRSKIWRLSLLQYPPPPDCHRTPLPHKSTQPPNYDIRFMKSYMKYILSKFTFIIVSNVKKSLSVIKDMQRCFKNRTMDETN